MMDMMILCTHPLCQTTAGCICGLSSTPVGGSVPLPLDPEKAKELAEALFQSMTPEARRDLIRKMNK